jgi:cell division protein FtsW
MPLSRADNSLLAEWWFTVDRQLLTALLVLVAVGILLSIAASPAVAQRIDVGAFHFVFRHLLFALAGVMLLLAVSLSRPAMIRRISLVVGAAALAMMVLVLLIGPERNGAQRWLVLLGQQIQPSELWKPAFTVLTAWLLAQAAERPQMPAVAIAVALFLLSAGLLALQPDIGQALLLTLVFGALLFVSGQPWRRIFLLAGCGAGALAVAYVAFEHVRSRFDRFMFPGKGDTFQMDRARESFIEGGWFGRGPGEGTIKTVLPDAHTDFIFAVVAEEYGVVACLLLLVLFVFVALRALSHVFEEPDGFRRNAIAGLVALVSLQTLINMGVNVGLLPAKGMTLPFISYGGSSMLGTALAMGMLLALTRHRPRPMRLKNTIFMGSERERDGR